MRKLKILPIIGDVKIVKNNKHQQKSKQQQNGARYIKAIIIKIKLFDLFIVILKAI